MTDGSKSRPLAKKSRAKTSVVLVGTVLFALGATTGVTQSQPTDQAPQQTPGTPTPPAAPPVVDPVLPAAEPPPEPTSADFGRTAPAPASEQSTSAPSTPAAPPAPPPIDWTAMPIDQLRAKANAGDIPAMEELARRLVQGIGVPKDQQAGAGWMLRAAQRGSAQSAFNVGVMYERGFVVERDSARAVEWYRKAADGGVAMAKHNLALMLREGKGAPRDGKEAIELLRSAARQGMSASMFTLGDIYERGDVTPKDQAMALAWFAITAEFENQTSRGGESQLGKTAAQRVQVLKRILLPGELERAQQFGQAEFKEIVATLQPAKPPAALPAPAPGEAARPPSPTPDPDPPGWPKSAADQIRAIQQALLDLKLVRDKPDGALGPMTRAAIRSFQRNANLRETGDPTKDVYIALQEAIARRDGKSEAKPKPEASETVATEQPKPPASSSTESSKPEAAAPSAQADSDPPGWPKAANEQVRAVQQALVDLGLLRDKPDGEIGPQTRNAIRSFQRDANLRETGEPSKEVYAALREALVRREANRPPASATEPNPPGWPKAQVEQVKAVQQALLDLNFSRDRPDGDIGPQTRDAIRAFQRSANLSETGEPSKEVYAALREALARREANKPPVPVTEPDPPGWPRTQLDQIKAVQQALLDLDFSRDKPDGDIGPQTRDAIRAFQRSANLSETGEPTKDVYAHLQRAIARRDAAPDPPGWPKGQVDQVKVIQQALVDLNLLRDKPDGDIGPMTRDAIRTFQRGANLRETGEPTRDVFAALQEAVARRSAPKPGAGQSTAAAMIDPGKHETTSTPPPSTDIARAEPKAEPPKADPNAWPTTTTEQVSAIQRLLRELNFTREEPDGQAGPLTRTAISDYQKSVGLPQTGEPTKELFESLKEMRKLTGGKPN